MHTTESDYFEIAGFEIRPSNFGANRSFYAKKSELMSDSLIHSFLVSDLSDSLTIAHSFQANWANCSQSLICPERPERFAHFAQKEWAKPFAFLKKL